jgi:hypothetical protein
MAIWCNFMAIWCNFRPFGILSGPLAYFYHFGMFEPRINLAALRWRREQVDQERPDQQEIPVGN